MHMYMGTLDPSIYTRARDPIVKTQMCTPQGPCEEDRAQGAQVHSEATTGWRSTRAKRETSEGQH